MAAAQASKAAERVEATSSRATERKAALQEKRLAQSARRAELADSVQEARRESDLDSLRKGVAEAQRAELAVETRHKMIERLRLRSSRNVQHALEVVRAQKQKDEELKQEKALQLEEKLSAAEGRRREIAEAADKIDEAARARNVTRARNEQVQALACPTATPSNPPAVSPSAPATRNRPHKSRSS